MHNKTMTICIIVVVVLAAAAAVDVHDDSYKVPPFFPIYLVLLFALQAAIEHYHQEIDGLIMAGIKPMVTLLHFTHPLWLDDEGGFENESAIPAFVKFSRRVYAEYGHKVRALLHRNSQSAMRTDLCGKVFAGERLPVDSRRGGPQSRSIWRQFEGATVMCR